MAIAVVAASLLIVGCVRDAELPGGPASETAAPTEYHRPSDLGVGECADLVRAAEDGALLAVARRPCGGPHDAEVIGVATHPTSAVAAYPGDTALLVWAEEACLAAFVDYVGSSYAGSDLMAFYDVPTERSWAGGDRRSPCLVVDLAGAKLTGSVRWAEPTDASRR